VTTARRPTREDLERAAGRAIGDVLAPGLVVFVGINPGLYSAAVGHHFARPGNRFWKALHGAGFTDRVLDPTEDVELPRFGLGVTNVVERPTASAAELAPEELREGARRLAARLAPLAPRVVAVLGLGAYRTGFGRADAVVGPQKDGIAGSAAWLLPNPSGLNANHQLPELIACFADLRRAVFADGFPSRPLGYGGRVEPVNDRAEFRLRLPSLDERTRSAVRSSLVDLPGVDDVRFGDPLHEVVVTADPAVVSEDELAAAVGEAGVEAEPV
jgi:double-stranded uracil-DNA glycosylase